MNVILNECSPNGICLLTLNRPEKHNAFDDYLIEQLHDELNSLEEDEKVKVIILQANGKNFSAGADLDWMKKMINFSEKENIEDAMRLTRLLKKLHGIKKPTIGLAKGYTLGGGIGLLACCDMVLAAKDAKFCFSETKLGLVPATIAPYIMQAIGPRLTQYYFLTAKTFLADEAKQIGLVQEVVENDLVTAGKELATSLLKNGQQALCMVKQLIANISHTSENIFHDTAVLLARVRSSTEAQEGLKAFFEKRAPNWSLDNNAENKNGTV